MHNIISFKKVDSLRTPDSPRPHADALPVHDRRTPKAFLYTSEANLTYHLVKD